MLHSYLDEKPERNLSCRPENNPAEDRWQQGSPEALRCLIAAQERELGNIARELHDDISQGQCSRLSGVGHCGKKLLPRNCRAERGSTVTIIRVFLADDNSAMLSSLRDELSKEFHPHQRGKKAGTRDLVKIWEADWHNSRVAKAHSIRRTPNDSAPLPPWGDRSKSSI